MEGETTYNQLCVHERQRRHCEVCNLPLPSVSTVRELEREQRRYEIARDVMAALYVDGPNCSGEAAKYVHSDIAKASVMAADALLKALEESSDGE